MKKRPAAILVIEDDAENQFLVVHAFQEKGFNDPLHFDANGLEAIGYLTSSERPSDDRPFGYPASALTTLNLRGTANCTDINGPKGKAKNGIVPSIVFSSSCDLEDIQKSYILGGTSYHKRPANMHAFRGRLKQLYAYWASRPVASTRHFAEASI
jgi:two-component system response regulator